MANGHHISCVFCTYNRSLPGRCDVFGVETSAFILCRAFRKPGQSHTAARKESSLLKTLSPGIVYGIDNNVFISGNPTPLYRVLEIEQGNPQDMCRQGTNSRGSE